jgi:hypothetical protein
MQLIDDDLLDCFANQIKDCLGPGPEYGVLQKGNLGFDLELFEQQAFNDLEEGEESSDDDSNDGDETSSSEESSDDSSSSNDDETRSNEVQINHCEPSPSLVMSNKVKKSEPIKSSSTALLDDGIGCAERAEHRFGSLIQEISSSPLPTLKGSETVQAQPQADTQKSLITEIE